MVAVSCLRPFRGLSIWVELSIPGACPPWLHALAPPEPGESAAPLALAEAAGYPPEEGLPLLVSQRSPFRRANAQGSKGSLGPECLSGALRVDADNETA
jgi:hypothetical protein